MSEATPHNEPTSPPHGLNARRPGNVQMFPLEFSDTEDVRVHSPVATSDCQIASRDDDEGQFWHVGKSWVDSRVWSTQELGQLKRTCQN